MKHRHLTHEEFTWTAIEDILDRGTMPDWEPLMTAIETDLSGEVAKKKPANCASARYTARRYSGASSPPRGRRSRSLRNS